MKRVGVFGGTFDPIHVGHLVAAEWAMSACNLDQVLFVPAGQPPHKAPGDVSAADHRYMMTVLGTLPYPDFAVHRVDLDREGPSYTVETLAALREELGVETHFIMGADSLVDLPHWYQPERLLDENRLIVANRPGWRREEAESALGELYAKYRSHITPVEIPALDISSREIRSRLRQGLSVRFLVPDLVLRYIERHRLYRGEGVALENA